MPSVSSLWKLPMRALSDLLDPFNTHRTSLPTQLDYRYDPEVGHEILLGLPGHSCVILRRVDVDLEQRVKEAEAADRGRYTHSGNGHRRQEHDNQAKRVLV